MAWTQRTDLVPGPRGEVAVIINLRSRRGAEAAESTARELERQGLRVTSYRRVKSARKLWEATRTAVASGVATVVVGGGDGTLSTVASLFVDRPDVSLGLLPMGTGNEVARELGIPVDLEGACRVIADGQTLDLHLPEANGRNFLHTALMGYPAQVNFAVPGLQKKRFGKVAYAFHFLRSVLGAVPFRASVEVDGESWERETTLVAVSNNWLNAPARVLIPPDEKKPLSLFVPSDCRRTTLLRLAFGLFVLRKPQPDLLYSWAADGFRVTATPTQPLDLDGENAGITPVVFRKGRSSLRIIAPSAATALPAGTGPADLPDVTPRQVA